MELQKQMKLDKECSTAMKGIAILFMMVHHGLGLPEGWFEPGLGYGQQILGSRMLFEWIGNPTKICVSLFAFLTGWSYCLHRTPTFRYGIKKTVQVLIQYWMVLFFLFYPAGWFISGYQPTVKDVIFNLFSIHNRAVSFSWYILFYAGCMCTLPILVKMVTTRWWIDVLSIPLLFTVVLHGLDRIVIQKWYLIADIRDYFYWMPIVWIGYVTAEYGWFDKIFAFLSGKKKWILLLLFLLVPVVRGVCPEFFRMNLDVVYAPIMVFGCAGLLQTHGFVFKGLYKLGQVSLYIWLIHAIFFWEKTRSFFQPIAYGVQNPLLTIVIILAVSFALAIVFDWLWKGLNKWKKKKVHKN